MIIDVIAVYILTPYSPTPKISRPPVVGRQIFHLYESK